MSTVSLCCLEKMNSSSSDVFDDTAYVVFRNITETVSSANASQIFSAFTFSSTIGAVGALENLLLLVVIIRQINSPNSGSQILVANLVFTYLLTCIFFTHQALYIGQATITMTLPLCRLLVFLLLFVYAAGMWTDVCLSFNRLVAIFRPHQYCLIVRNRLNYALVVGCWLVSTILVILIAGEVQGNQIWMSSVTNQCNLMMKTPKVIGLFCLFTMVPYALISCASIAIATKSVKINRNRSAKVADRSVLHVQDFRLFRRRLHVAKMLFTSFMWRSFCNLPSFLFHIFFQQWMVLDSSIHMWLNVLLATEFVGNPVRYRRASILYLSLLQWKLTVDDLWPPSF